MNQGTVRGSETAWSYIAGDTPSATSAMVLRCIEAGLGEHALPIWGCGEFNEILHIRLAGVKRRIEEHLKFAPCMAWCGCRRRVTHEMTCGLSGEVSLP